MNPKREGEERGREGGKEREFQNTESNPFKLI